MGLGESKTESKPLEKTEEPSTKVEEKKSPQIVKSELVSLDKLDYNKIENQHTYFLFDSGIDIGKNYVLPKNVRVLMRCTSTTGMYYEAHDTKWINDCTITDPERLKIWKACFDDTTTDKYMTNLTDYCVYDNNSIIPDIVIWPRLIETYPEIAHKKTLSFLSGICEMPFKLNFLSKELLCGKTLEIDPYVNIKYNNQLNMTLQENNDYIYRNKSLKDILLTPDLTEGKRYYTNSQLRTSIGRTACQKPKNKLINIYGKDRVATYPNQHTIENVRVIDTCINCESGSQKYNDEIIKNYEDIVDRGGGMYLSDIISFLCDINKDVNTKITIILSTCHILSTLWHYDYRIKYKTTHKWDTQLRKRRGMPMDAYLKSKYAVPKGGMSDDDNYYYHKYMKYKVKYDHITKHK